MIRGQGHPFALFAKGWASALPQSSGAAGASRTIARGFLLIPLPISLISVYTEVTVCEEITMALSKTGHRR